MFQRFKMFKLTFTDKNKTRKTGLPAKTREVVKKIFLEKN